MNTEPRPERVSQPQKQPPVKTGAKREPKAPAQAPMSATERRSGAKALPKLAMTILGGVAALGVLFGAYSMFAPAPGTDKLTTQQQQQYQQNQTQLLANGVKSKPLSKGDALRELKTGSLRDLPQAAQLAAAIAAETIELREIGFYDSAAEDGDVIRVSANGISRIISLSKSPTITVLPYLKGRANTFTVSVVADGGDVATPGIVTQNSSVPFSTLETGISVTFPFK